MAFVYLVANLLETQISGARMALFVARCNHVGRFKAFLNHLTASQNRLACESVDG